jgi:hypothetical protein
MLARPRAPPGRRAWPPARQPGADLATGCDPGGGCRHCPQRSRNRRRTVHSPFPRGPFGWLLLAEPAGNGTLEELTSQEWSQSGTASDGVSWSTAQNTQRVYEYAVEPTVLQHLPRGALLLPARSTTADLLAVECDPQIITLPGAAASLAAAGAPAPARRAGRAGGG